MSAPERRLFWHSESVSLFESSDHEDIERLRKTVELEDVTGLPEWEARFQKEQNTMMTDEQFDRLYKLFSDGLSRMNHALQTIAEATVQVEHNLGRLASAGSSSSPNFFKNLSAFPTFDWSTINAEVVERDRDGVSVVEWEGRMFTRRRGNADYEPALYFSVCTGKDADGKNQYDRLITFKQPSKAKRVPEETRELVEKEPPPRQEPVRPPAQTAAQRQPQRVPIEEVTERIAPPPTRPEPPANDGVRCSLPSWDKLNKTVVAANKAGVPPEKWKPKVKNLIGTDDMKTLNDADIAKATQIIAGMAETARAAGASAGVS